MCYYVKSRRSDAGSGRNVSVDVYGTDAIKYKKEK